MKRSYEIHTYWRDKGIGSICRVSKATWERLKEDELERLAMYWRRGARPGSVDVFVIA